MCQSTAAFEPTHYEANDKKVYRVSEELKATTNATFTNLQRRADVSRLGNRNVVALGDESNRSSFHGSEDEPDV